MHLKALDNIQYNSFISIELPASKSISNRLLILNALSNENICINNLSHSSDTQLLKHILDDFSKMSSGNKIDAKDAGTTFRFLTSFLALQEEKEVILTGTERMKERPIKELVSVLNTLGASIQYLEKEGFPPISITGKHIAGGSIEIDTGISSQYITSLLLIAWKLPKGLEIAFKGEKLVSQSYIQMTLHIFDCLGVEYAYTGTSIQIKGNQSIKEQSFFIENDWSSASYWYNWCLGTKGSKFLLKNLSNRHFQGDAQISKIYEALGVKTSFEKDGVWIENIKEINNVHELTLDCVSHPDLFQTLVLACVLTKTPCKLKGLYNLRIKETDRIQAVESELQKLDIISVVTEDTFSIKQYPGSYPSSFKLNSFGDHRMALAFSTLASIMDVYIDDPKVVDKSYPTYWDEVSKLYYI